MTKILAIDTSTHACSAALYVEGYVQERYQFAPQLHGEILLAMIEDLLQSAQLTLDQVNAIAYGCGPGSFTGIRMAASVAQGLAFGVKKPAVAISSLLALADAFYRCLGYTQIACAFDARMKEVYWGAYQLSMHGWTAITPDCVIAPQDVPPLPEGPWIGVGDGWKNYQHELQDSTGITHAYPRFYPHASSMARLAANYYQSGIIQTSIPAMPHYLRDKVV